MPIYVLVDGMGPSDRLTFAIGDTQPSDLLTSAAKVCDEHVVKSEDGHIGIVEDA